MENKPDKRFLKSNYKILFAELTQILNKNDPAGLIRLDFPEDEYSCEVTDILAGLRKCKSLEDTCNLVATVFNDAFDSDFASGKYIDLAEPIWVWWKKQSERK
jgi:hypothetical protein